MPAFKNHNATLGVPLTRQTGPNPILRLSDAFNPIFEERNYTITGITKNSAAVTLSSCNVYLFLTATNVLEQTVVSDANGSYTFVVDKNKSFYSVSYKAGAPDVAGTTVNTLAGT